MLILASTLGGSTLALGGSTLTFGGSTLALGGSILGASTFPPILIPALPFFDEELLDDEELDFFFPPIFILASILGGSTLTFGGSTFALGGSILGASTFPPILIPALPFFDEELLLDDEELDFFFPPILILASTFGGSTLAFGGSILAFGGSTLGGSTLTLGASTFPPILIPALPFFDDELLLDEDELDFFFPPMFILASTFGGSTLTLGGSTLALGGSILGASTFPPILIPALPFFDDELLLDDELDFFFPPMLSLASTLGGSTLTFGGSTLAFGGSILGTSTFPPILIPALPFFDDELLEDDELDFFFPPMLILASTLGGSTLALGGSTLTFGGSTLTFGGSILGASTFPPILIPALPFLEDELLDDEELDFFFPPIFILASTLGGSTLTLGGSTLAFGGSILGASTFPPILIPALPFFEDELLEDDELDFFFPPMLILASTLGGSTLTFGGSTLAFGGSIFGTSTLPPTFIPALPFFEDELLLDDELDFFFPPIFILASTFGGSTLTFGGSTFIPILALPLPEEELLDELDFLAGIFTSTFALGASILGTFGGSTLTFTFAFFLLEEELLEEDFFAAILIFASIFGGWTLTSALGAETLTFFFFEELEELEELDFLFKLTLTSASIVPVGGFTLISYPEDEDDFLFLPCFLILASALTTGKSIFPLALCPFFELELELELELDFLWWCLCFLCLCLVSPPLFLKLRSTCCFNGAFPEACLSTLISCDLYPLPSLVLVSLSFLLKVKL